MSAKPSLAFGATGGAGYPALTVYGLTLAFFQGPEIFSKAIDTLTKQKK